MSFATKYNLTFKDFLGTQWDIDFQVDGFSGTITDLIGTGDPVKINYEAGEFYTHSPIKASSVEINLIEFTDDAYREFFISDKVAKVKIYKGIDLYWQGWTIAEGYNSLYNVPPKSVTLTAVDGLTFLKNIPLEIDDSLLIDEPGIYSLYKFLKQAFDQIGLGAQIYESLNIYDYRMNTNLSPVTELNLDTWAFYEDGEYKKLYDIITDLLTIFGARIYQKDGAWYIDHIRQLSNDTITYRVYNSSFVYTGTSVETRYKTITSKSGSPRLVPINHSLYKEFERPYSEFTLNTDYKLSKNMIRYPDIFDVNNVQYAIKNKLPDVPDFKEEWILTIDDTGKDNPTVTGILYDLGRVDFKDINDVQFWWGKKPEDITQFMFSCSLKLKGWCKIRLYIDNEADGIKYYYTYRPDLDTPSEVKWLEFNDFDAVMYEVADSPTGFGDNSCLAVLKHNDLNVAKDFSFSIPVYIPNSELKGHMYLQFCPPWFSAPNKALLEIDLNALKFDCLQANRQNNKIKLTNSSFLANVKDMTVGLYSEPLYFVLQSLFTGQMQEVDMHYTNPHITYPGMFYYSTETEYLPCREFIIGGQGDKKTLEAMLVEDIMTYYSILRNRLTGVLLGDMSFGDSLDYDSKRYMIAAHSFDVKKSQHEVTLLQISEVGAFMLNDDGSYVLDDQGDKMPV